MAFRTWGKLLLTALGVSVLAGAGQLGVAYGFGIVRLTGAFTGTTVNQWPAQLVWAGWFAANAAVAGAVLTGRLARRDVPAASTGRQLAVGGAAALGATVIAPLCMQPARAAELISVDPVWAVGICAMVGAVIGAGAAIAVLFRPELGWNMTVVAGAVWLLALISVLPSLGTVGPLPTVRLGVLEPSWLSDAAAQRLALLLLPTVALLAGAATAGLARWRGQAPLVSGATGVAGPVLVAFAYLTAGPGDAVDRYQATPYYGSLIAILAGALGAAAAALLRWPTGTRTADPQAIKPTAILRPLPAGPALPDAASANDRDTAERADPESANAELSTRAQPGVVAGPWPTGDPEGVRTVPAHWDWPGTTASGQHGPTPAAAPSASTPPSPADPLSPAGPLSPADPLSPAGPLAPAGPSQPAAWLTAPTGELAAAAQTPSVRDDDVPATTGPSASADASAATATSSTAGRADAINPAGGRAADGPTGSAATGTSGKLTGRRATRKAAAPTSTDAPGTDTTGTQTTATGTTATETTGTDTTGTDTTGTDTTGTDTTGHSTPEPPQTIKPRRTRKPKTDPDAVADGTSPTDTTATPETATPETATPETATPETSTGGTATGRATRGTRPDRSADSVGSDAATATAVPGQGSQGERSGATSEPTSAADTGTAAARSTATGGRRATATGSKRTPATSTTAGADTTSVPADVESPATATAESPTTTAEATHAPATTAGATHTPTTADARRAPAAPTASGDSAAEATASPHVPRAGTGSSTAAADLTSDSVIAGGTDSAGAAAEVPAAGLFGATAADDPDTDRWTPAPSAWPVTSTWTVPPQTAEPGTTASDGSRGPDEPTEPTPRPRHRAPLPDLSRAGTWNAFDTSRRARSTEPRDSSAARTTSTGTSEPAVAAEHPKPTEVPGTVGTPTGATDSGTGDPAGADATSAALTPAQVAEQPSRRGRLGGLFRRNRSRADEEDPKASDAAEPLAAQDEEFVDWVAGLSKPVSDNEPEQETGRRSLRSSGRHHRD
ncbi:hypothetical protein ACIBTW_10035 [Micromonospora parva]|uniref:hypothetical protein n=1 Tax=Micromonospora parva TaxID=1464048 RepID=UPI0037A8A82B